MVIKGKITDVREDGTAVIIASINTSQYIRQGIKECYVDYIDNRPISDKQRRMCYALINAISEWSGSSVQDVKEAFKLEFWADKVDTLADRIFSLSNAPMSLVREFQKFLVMFIIENDVPVKRPLINYVDDIEHYTFMCLLHKKCVVCGRKAELHHMNGSTVGMGRDRDEIDHLGCEALSVCRDHHEEAHKIGQSAFLEKYHLTKGIEVDKSIAKLYGLKIKKEK